MRNTTATSAPRRRLAAISAPHPRFRRRGEAPPRRWATINSDGDATVARRASTAWATLRAIPIHSSSPSPSKLLIQPAHRRRAATTSSYRCARRATWTPRLKSATTRARPRVRHRPRHVDVTEDRSDRGGELVGIPRVDQETGYPVFDVLGGHREPGRHHRGAGGHRLERSQPQSFHPAGEHQYIGESGAAAPRRRPNPTA